MYLKLITFSYRKLTMSNRVYVITSVGKPRPLPLAAAIHHEAVIGITLPPNHYPQLPSETTFQLKDMVQGMGRSTPPNLSSTDLMVFATPGMTFSTLDMSVLDPDVTFSTPDMSFSVPDMSAQNLPLSTLDMSISTPHMLLSPAPGPSWLEEPAQIGMLPQLNQEDVENNLHANLVELQNVKVVASASVQVNNDTSVTKLSEKSQGILNSQNIPR